MVAVPSNLPEDERIVDDKDARIRLLICNVCNTIEPLPDFSGPAEYDDTLNHRLLSHRTAEGHPHRGALATVSELSWKDDTRRQAILEELSKARGNPDVGLGHNLYDLRSTYQEDAMRCWRFEHNRTQNCEDYKSDKKRLVQNDEETRSLRREVGAESRSKHIQSNTWLCNFCPVHTLVMEKIRKAEGYY